jgi:hypothetical protein
MATLSACFGRHASTPPPELLPPELLPLDDPDVLLPLELPLDDPEVLLPLDDPLELPLEEPLLLDPLPLDEPPLDPLPPPEVLPPDEPPVAEPLLPQAMLQIKGRQAAVARTRPVKERRVVGSGRFRRMFAPKAVVWASVEGS